MKQTRFLVQPVKWGFWMLCIFLSINVRAELGNWVYKQEKDQLSNLTYSFARSPMPQRGLYDNIRLEIVCKQNKLQLVVDGNNLITSQDRPFEMDYQIDQRSPVVVKMRTFTDSKQRGYTEENVKGIVDDILSGKTIFVRIHTMIRRVLTGAIGLNDAAEPIKQVLSDCGVSVSEPTDDLANYTLTEFQQDFSKLTAEQQLLLLKSLKAMLQEIKQR